VGKKKKGGGKNERNRNEGPPIGWWAPGRAAPAQGHVVMDWEDGSPNVIERVPLDLADLYELRQARGLA